MIYWGRVSSVSELLGDEGLLKLPSHLSRTFVVDDSRRVVIERAVSSLRSGGNVLIVGSPGTGKTALMFMVLKELLDSGYCVGFVFEGAPFLTNEHVGEGCFVFYDDLPKLNFSALRSIVSNGVRGLIATARREEVHRLNEFMGGRVDEFFDVVEVGVMSGEHLREMFWVYADAEKISVSDPDAVDLVVEKASGLPVYVWQVIRELRISGRSLTRDFAERIPQGMYDYVDDILWRVIGTHEDRYAVLLTLLVVSDLPRYTIHQDVFNAFFAVAKSDLQGVELNLKRAILSDVLDNITRYLIRDGANYAFKLPHDSWGDVLKGKSRGLMSGEISRVNSIYPEKKRWDLFLRAIELAYNEIIKLSSDEHRKRTFDEFVFSVLGEGELKSIFGEEVVEKIKESEMVAGEAVASGKDFVKVVKKPGEIVIMSREEYEKYKKREKPSKPLAQRAVASKPKPVVVPSGGPSTVITSPTKLSSKMLEMIERAKKESENVDAVGKIRVYERYKRSPLIALFLSFIFPGLGHFYIGDESSGTLYLVLAVVSILLAIIVVGIIMYIVVWLVAMVSSYQKAEEFNKLLADNVTK